MAATLNWATKTIDTGFAKITERARLTVSANVATIKGRATGATLAEATGVVSVVTDRRGRAVTITFVDGQTWTAEKAAGCGCR